MSRRVSARDHRARAPIGGAIADPRTIFSGVSLLWLDGMGGAYLRDGGGAVPDDAEQIATLIDRGTVGNATAGTGVTYSAASASNRGGIYFDGTAAAVVTTPAWVLSNVSSGGAVWRPSGNNQGLFCHGAVNSHSSVFTELGNVKSRRVAAGDAAVAISYDPRRITLWRSRVADGDIRDSLAGNATTVDTRAIPATSVATTIGALSAAVYRLTGTVNEIVIANCYATAEQLDALNDYFRPRWGL